MPDPTTYDYTGLNSAIVSSGKTYEDLAELSRKNAVRSTISNIPALFSNLYLLFKEKYKYDPIKRVSAKTIGFTPTDNISQPMSGLSREYNTTVDALKKRGQVESLPMLLTNYANAVNKLQETQSGINRQERNQNIEANQRAQMMADEVNTKIDMANSQGRFNERQYNDQTEVGALQGISGTLNEISQTWNQHNADVGGMKRENDKLNLWLSQMKMMYPEDKRTDLDLRLEKTISEANLPESVDDNITLGDPIDRMQYYTGGGKFGTQEEAGLFKTQYEKSIADAKAKEAEAKAAQDKADEAIVSQSASNVPRIGVSTQGVVDQYEQNKKAAQDEIDRKEAMKTNPLIKDNNPFVTQDKVSETTKEEGNSDIWPYIEAGVAGFGVYKGLRHMPFKGNILRKKVDWTDANKAADLKEAKAKAATPKAEPKVTVNEPVKPNVVEPVVAQNVEPEVVKPTDTKVTEPTMPKTKVKTPDGVFSSSKDINRIMNSEKYNKYPETVKSKVKAEFDKISRMEKVSRKISKFGKMTSRSFVFLSLLDVILSSVNDSGKEFNQLYEWSPKLHTYVKREEL